MNVIILEDEKLAVERLQLLLGQVDPTIQVVAALESVEQATALFTRSGFNADLLLVDIHLADGSVFELLQQVNIPIPIIFTTAYDQYAIDAFKVLSIDYLLKPISRESLSKALTKMKLLQGNPSISIPNYGMLTGDRMVHKNVHKSRFLGRIGQKWHFIPTADIAFISADNRIVQVTAMDKAKYLVDHTLDQLEHELDPTFFFRINRSMIIHAAAIVQVKPFINHRLRLTLKHPFQSEDIVVSRDRVTDFKKWADS